MKNFVKITLIIVLFLFSVNGFAKGTDMTFFNDVGNVSIKDNGTTNVVESFENVATSLLTTIKYILMGVFVLYMVYNGVMMIISQGSDEEQLSKSKRQIWYSVVALLFINIPGTLYDSFNTGELVGNSSIGGSWKDKGSSNIFFDFSTFENTLEGQVIGFMKVIIFGLAIFFIMLSGIKLLTSRGREDVVKESKIKIIYSLFALIFVGLIHAWQNFIFTGDLDDGTSLFKDMANLALYLAVPIAVFFLTMAAYYYITSAGDEDKIKKAKNIVINIVIATIILLASYTFLLDLAKLSF
ncbi:hypothetical protein CSB08_00635 [Candidatus Gracilibacteria bacterium]|nr:MAG: hypothetical protein CSB08_00635 [Candidatus Gracilibacteria bacterium]PIE84969.1 MAG: hypothetical protein CSA08_04420 [Candidatus Gracilibacteria bacterium]